MSGIFTSGASLLGGTIDAISGGIQNRKAREYADKAYARSRADALADWNMQNEYNSPAAQMARFKAAGLNPNLIYGQTNTAPPVRSTEKPDWKPEPIRPGSTIPQAVMGFYDTQIKKQAVKVSEMQELKLAQDIANAKTKNKLDEFTLSQKNRLANVVYEAAIEKLLQSKSETTIKGNQASYSGAHYEHMTQIEQRTIARMDEQIKNLEANTQLQKTNKRLAEANIKKTNQQTQDLYMRLQADLPIKHAMLLNMFAARTKDDAMTWKVMHEVDNLVKDGKLKEAQLYLYQVGKGNPFIETGLGMLKSVFGGFSNGNVKSDTRPFSNGIRNAYKKKFGRQ